MTHPTHEELMELLYGELPEDRQSTVNHHVKSCPQCAAKVSTWRGTMNRMSGWTLPQRVKATGRPRIGNGLQRWAAAAALIALAIMAGVLARQVQELRGELVQSRARALEIARGEAQQAVTAMEARLEQIRATDQRTYMAALQQIQLQHAQAYAGLRKELETVAVLTEASLQQAHTEIANISSPTRQATETSQPE